MRRHCYVYSYLSKLTPPACQHLPPVSYRISYMLDACKLIYFLQTVVVANMYVRPFRYSSLLLSVGLSIGVSPEQGQDPDKSS